MTTESDEPGRKAFSEAMHHLSEEVLRKLQAMLDLGVPVEALIDHREIPPELVPELRLAYGYMREHHPVMPWQPDVDDKDQAVNLAGKIMAQYVKDDAWVYFELGDVVFLPIFSTKANAERALRECGIEGTKLLQISHHSEFAASVLGKIRVMLDPRQIEAGKVKWTEIILS